MIKDALKYLVGLKDNKTYEINGHSYSDNALVRIDPPKHSPSGYNVGSLDALVKMIVREYGRVCAIDKPFICARSQPDKGSG